MRYGIVSDIHSNLEALEAVVEALSKEGVDKCLCAGDIVGYGADPIRCIERIKGLTGAAVRGNHDAALTGEFDIGNLQPLAKNAVLWTEKNITDKEIDYLKGLVPVYEDAVIAMVHGSMEEPDEFYYMFSEDDARKSFQVWGGRLLFVGHTHRPVAFCLSGKKIEASFTWPLKIKAESRYIVNVGSVGQPRDGDPRAAYCIYDSESQSVQIKRVSYDLEGAQRKILKAGIDPILAYRLAAGG